MGLLLAQTRPSVSAFPERVVGSACTSSVSRLAQRSLALRPAHSRRHQIRDQLSEGFRHFVSSMPAPVASGWSGRRVGLAPTGKAPPSHGAHPKQTSRAGRPLSLELSDAGTFGSSRYAPLGRRLSVRSGCEHNGRACIYPPTIEYTP